MKIKQAPKGATQRVKFVYDDDYQFGTDDDCYPQTREEYEGNEYNDKDGNVIPFDVYIRTIGDLNNHVAVGIVHEVKCACCGHWSSKGSLWGIDCNTEDYLQIDEIFYPEDIDNIRVDYLKEVAQEAFRGDLDF
jgi:hypothetical protein